MVVSTDFRTKCDEHAAVQISGQSAHCLLPTAHCLLPTAHCLLPTAYCPLPTASSLLFHPPTPSHLQTPQTKARFRHPSSHVDNKASSRQKATARYGA